MPSPANGLNKIVFFGTGLVSLATLEGIADAFDIEAVITKPDVLSPYGKPHSAPVRLWAEDRGIQVYQPANKAELSKFFQEHKFESQVGLVVDYGIIIPQDVIDSFPLAIVNSHFSLLPKYRGADPITAAILNGDKETGVCLMLIVPALDEGPLLAEESLLIADDWTTPELTEALVELSNKIIRNVLPQYISGFIEPKDQDTSIAPSYTAKLQKSDGVLDWNKPAVQLAREIRGFIGWPGSRTRLVERDLTITKAHVEPGILKPGEVDATKKRLAVGTAQDVLVIDRLKPSGKREMSAIDFLSGLRNS